MAGSWNYGGPEGHSHFSFPVPFSRFPFYVHASRFSPFLVSFPLRVSIIIVPRFSPLVSVLRSRSSHRSFPVLRSVMCVSVTLHLTSRVFVRLRPTQRALKVRKYARFSLKMLRCKSHNFIAAENAHAVIMLIRPSPSILKATQRRACIDSRMLSTTIASLCQTLRELY